jgi:type I site-specific restriction endonuclease
MRNEADTRATLVDPKLKAAGWTDAQITREHYYQRDQQYTPGRIILVGDRVRRGEARKVDYLLRVTDALPIAVVEAEAEDEPAEAGLEQAKRYAQDLGLAFAYATNGREIIEYDFFTNTSRNLDKFPSRASCSSGGGKTRARRLQRRRRQNRPRSTLPAGIRTRCFTPTALKACAGSAPSTSRRSRFGKSSSGSCGAAGGCSSRWPPGRVRPLSPFRSFGS